MGEGRSAKQLFCTLHMAYTCYGAPEKCKKIGLFCRIPFFEVEEAEQSAFE